MFAIVTIAILAVAPVHATARTLGAGRSLLYDTEAVRH